MKISAATPLLAVLGFTAICYGNSLNGGWVFDDLAIRMWLGPGLSAEAVREFGISHRPLLWLTYWLNAKQGGLDATFIYHATNLIFHLLTVAVVFGICRKILESNEGAGVGAAIFGIHPFFTSTVNYIDGRGSLMAAFFVLLAGWLLIQFQSWRKWPLAILSLACAFAVKEEAVAFLVLVLGFGIVMERKWLVLGSIALMVAGIAGIAILAPYIPTVFTSNATRPVQSLLLNGFDILTRNQQLQAVFNGFVFHNIRQWIWPNALTIDPAPVLGWWKLGFSFLILGTALLLILWKRVDCGLRLGLVCFFSSPMLGASVIMLADPTFEYRSYICGLGIALISGTLFLWLMRWPQIAAMALCTVVMAFGLMTTQRNEVWRTSLGLWEEAHRLAPDRIRTSQNYSADLLAVNRPQDAVEVLQSVLENRPNLRGANANLALAYLHLGKSQEAERHAQKGLPLFSAYMYLSLAQMGLNQRENAEASAKTAVDLEPRSSEAWGILAQAMARNGKNYQSYLAQAHQRGLIQIAQTQMKP